MSDSTFTAFIVLWVVACTLLPAALVAISRRAVGGERLLWTIAVLFTSWLGFVAFMVVTSVAPRARVTANADRRPRRYVPRATEISDHRPG